jgi:hypothetical protein
LTFELTNSDEWYSFSLSESFRRESKSINKIN